MKFSTVAAFALAAAVALPVAAKAADAPAAFAPCKGCHKTVEGQKGFGPNLFGVVGRKAGTEAGYNYSPAMKAAGFTWTPEQLTKYITNPKAVVPHNKMPFFGVKDAAKVKQIVSYLETLKK